MNNEDKKQSAGIESGQTARPGDKKTPQQDSQKEAAQQEPLDKIEGRMNNGEIGGGLKKEEGN